MICWQSTSSSFGSRDLQAFFKPNIFLQLFSCNHNQHLVSWVLTYLLTLTRPGAGYREDGTADDLQPAPRCDQHPLIARSYQHNLTSPSTALLTFHASLPLSHSTHRTRAERQDTPSSMAHPPRPAHSLPLLHGTLPCRSQRPSNHIPDHTSLPLHAHHDHRLPRSRHGVRLQPAQIQ